MVQREGGMYSWGRRDLPELYTPVNSMQAIRERRLVIVAYQSNESVSFKPAGMINLKLNMLQAVNLDKQGIRTAMYCHFEK